MSKTMLIAGWALLLAPPRFIDAPVAAGGRDERVRGPAFILYHGKISTADPAVPRAEALTIQRDRIAAVGTDEAVLAAPGEGTLKIDLGGRTVIPGSTTATTISRVSR